MSRGANLSIMGLYNNDNTIFDLMNYPNGFTATQQDTFIKNVLVECAEFEILYPAPTVMKSIIGIWSAKEKPYWDRVYAASQIQYDPIENYHRTETETTEDGRTEEHSGNDTLVKTGTDTSAKTGTDTSAKTGTDTSTKTGTDTSAKTGTETNAKTGTETNAKTGTETTERIGDNENILDETNKETNSGSDSQDMSSDISETHSGNDTATTEVTGYDSNALVIRDKVTTAHGHVITTDNDSESSQTFGHIVDVDHDSTLTTTIDETDTVTHNTTDTLTHNTSDTLTHDTTDTLTHNTTDTLAHNTTDTLTHDTTDTLTHNTTDTTTHGEVIEHTGETSRSLEAYGNIGTMTTQDMLTQELELAKIIQVIPIMIESFKNRFCLMVY